MASSSKQPPWASHQDHFCVVFGIDLGSRSEGSRKTFFRDTGSGQLPSDSTLNHSFRALEKKSVVCSRFYAVSAQCPKMLLFDEYLVV